MIRLLFLFQVGSSKKLTENVFSRHNVTCYFCMHLKIDGTVHYTVICIIGHIPIHIVPLYFIPHVALSCITVERKTLLVLSLINFFAYKHTQRAPCLIMPKGRNFSCLQ